MTFSWVVAPKGAICVACLSAILDFQEFCQRINFRFTWTTEHQPTRNLHCYAQVFGVTLRPLTSKHIFPPHAIIYHKICEYLHSKRPSVSLFLTTLSTALSSSCSTLSISPTACFPNIFKDVHHGVHGIPEQLNRFLVSPFLNWLPDSSPNSMFCDNL